LIDPDGLVLAFCCTVSYYLTLTTPTAQGSDFQDLSEITVQFWPEDATDVAADHHDNLAKTATFEVERHRITSKIEEDPTVKGIVDSFLDHLKEKLGDSIGASAVPLDGRFSSVRTMETNLGNFVTDAVLDACQNGNGSGADCVIMNSGTLRADRLFPPGNLTFLDLQVCACIPPELAIASRVRAVEVTSADMHHVTSHLTGTPGTFLLAQITLPLMDELCVIGLTGKQLLAALENGVSKWPALEGRFPQVAGIRFLFDPEQAPGNRIVAESVEVADAPLDYERVYGVAAKSFVGKSGKVIVAAWLVVVPHSRHKALTSLPPLPILVFRVHQ
jgi:5'-nucleotidase